MAHSAAAFPRRLQNMKALIALTLASLIPEKLMPVPNTTSLILRPSYLISWRRPFRVGLISPLNTSLFFGINRVHHKNSCC
jgi:hypothetical protein